MSANVLVALKRVPDATSSEGRRRARTASPSTVAFSGFISLTRSGRAGRAGRGGDRRPRHALGDADAVEQLRAALAVGDHRGHPRPGRRPAVGPADVAREIAAVVRNDEAAGHPDDLALLGNDAADNGDFQVGIRLAYELGRPVVTGVTTVSVADVDGELVVTASGDEPDATRRPRGAAARRGYGARGRCRAALSHGARPDEGQGRHRRGPQPSAAPTQQTRVRWTLPPAAPSDVQVLGTGPRWRRRGRPARRSPMILVLVEKDLHGAAVRGVPGDAHLRASRSPRGGCVSTRSSWARSPTTCRPGSRRTACARFTRPSRRFAGAAWASGIETVLAATETVVVTAAGRPAVRRRPTWRLVVAWRWRPTWCPSTGWSALRGQPAGRRWPGGRGDAGSPAPPCSPSPGTRSRRTPAKTPAAAAVVEHAPRWPRSTWSRGWSPPRSPSPTCLAA